MVRVTIGRIGLGPRLVIEEAELLVRHFLDTDASAKPGGYDDLAGQGVPDRITRDDVVAINSTMRARSPHEVWESLIGLASPLPWLAAIDPAWDLVEAADTVWQERIRQPVEQALTACTGFGRGYSVGTKVLHLKRPHMFPVLDSLVLQQLGVTESVPMLQVVEHLRDTGRQNRLALLDIADAIAPRQRSAIRLLDILLWASHPASGLTPTLGDWQHTFGPRQGGRRDSASPKVVTRNPAPATPGPAPTVAPTDAQPPLPSATGVARTARGRSFDEIWLCIRSKGGMRVVSTRGTVYRVVAEVSKGRRVLIGKLPSGGIYVHADCFGDDITCQGTRAGGLYHGSPSVYDC